MSDLQRDIENNFITEIIQNIVPKSESSLIFAAHFGVLLVLIYEDGKIEEKEIQFLSQYSAEKLGISLKDGQKMVDQSIKVLGYGFNIKNCLEQFCQFINLKSDQNQKRELIQQLEKMAKADQEYNSLEENLIKETIRALNLTI